MAETVVVSACLAGISCRYDGGDSLNAELMESLSDSTIVPLCPEQLGGLPTPRQPSEICGGTGKEVLSGKASVISSEGDDLTESFIRGAKEGLKIVKLSVAKRVFLKEKSPSCGVAQIKRGGITIEGSGVFAALLKMEGMKITGI